LSADQALDFLNEMLWAGLIVAAPVLLAMLVVGLLISVLQVTTQIQEVTLSYVPKILVSAFILIAIGPWMMGRVTAFAMSLYQQIPELAR
jgi:flagellar biosynthetic protein FliQ